MKNWREYTTWKIGDYVLQLSVVVLGIIITFAGSSVISGYIESKQIANTMQLVKSELQQNLQRVEQMHEILLSERKVSDYVLLYENDLTKASEDTLMLYVSQPLQLNIFTYTSDALEMLKMSSLAQQIQDKELILQIVKSYNDLKNVQDVVKFFYDLKLKYSEMIYSDENVTKKLKELEGNINENIYSYWQVRLGNNSFHTILDLTSTGVNFEPKCETAKETLNQAITMIDKKYN